MADFKVYKTMSDGIESCEPKCCGTCSHFVMSTTVRGKDGCTEVGVCKINLDEYKAGKIRCRDVVVAEFDSCEDWEEYDG